jgi:hypothetical protein
MTNHTQLIIRLKQMPKQGAPGLDAFDKFKDALSDVFKVYKAGANDLMRQNVFEELTKSVQGAYETVNILEKRNRGLAESLGINTSRAAALGTEFDKMAVKLSVNADKLKQYAGELNKLIPGQTRFLKTTGGLGEKISKQMVEMRNNLKLSDEQYQQLLKNQTLFAKTQSDIAGGMNAFESIITQAASEYGTTFEGVEKSVTDAVAAMDSEAAARFGKMSKTSFVQAVMGAKKLGIEMNKLLSIGDNFLDVESAIANELELQLLGAKELNVAEIQRAAYAGNANELQKQLTSFIKANGEQLKENPILLEKAAAAFNMQKSELLDMYATWQLNNEAGKEAGAIIQSNLGDTKDLRTEQEKLQDAANLKLAQEVLKSTDNIQQKVLDISNAASAAQTKALDGAGTIINALSKSDFIQTLQAGYLAYKTADAFISGVAGSKTPAAVSNTLGETKPGNDLFIPSNGGNTVISGPFGAFTMNPGDDILAAPNIREAAGGSTGALIAALSKMSFHVTNVFDGDKIKSQLEIRQGQTLNNINNIA